MPSSFSASGRTLIYLAAIVIIVAGMKAAADFLVLVLLSAFIAILGSSPVEWLRSRLHLPTGVGLTVVMTAVLLGGAVIASSVGSSLQSFGDRLPEYSDRLTDLESRVLDYLPLPEAEDPNAPRALVDLFDEKAVMNAVTATLSQLSSLLTKTFLVLIIAIFMLLEAATFPRKIAAITVLPDQTRSQLGEVVHQVKHYMALKGVVSFMTGVLVGISVALVGVPYAVLWGALAFFLNFVPNIGSVLAAIPPLLLALLEPELGLGHASVLAGCYLVVNIVVSNVVEPRLLGRELGLSTLAVFLSLFFWSWLLGAIGMLLAVPLTMGFKIILDTIDETRWIATLLGNKVAPS